MYREFILLNFVVPQSYTEKTQSRTKKNNLNFVNLCASPPALKLRWADLRNFVQQLFSK